MKKIAVIPNIYKDPELKITKKITDLLDKSGAETKVLNAECKSEDLSGFDCAVVLGGDGTVLDIAKKAAVYGIPVAGVNLGKIGYLASVELDELDKLASLDKNTHIEKRMMLLLKYRGQQYTALNDFVISGKRASKMISVSVEADGEPSSDYNSTALIFSTPTGSSGYNVSAGGPVIDPTLECIAGTPVCPHTGTARSCIYGKDAVFTLKNVSSADKEVNVSVDGGPELPLELDEIIKISRSDKYVSLIKFDNEPFARTLVRKMKI